MYLPDAKALKIILVGCLLLLPLMLSGCGGEEPAPQSPPPQASAPQPPAPEAPKPTVAIQLNASDLKEEDAGPVDFASLAAFPEMKYEAISSITAEGDARVPLSDGAAVAGADGKPIENWVAKAPSFFVVNLPADKGHLHVYRLEVEDGGGDKSFMLCSVAFQTPENSSWMQPEGIRVRMEKPVSPEAGIRHIIEFDEVHASAIRVAFPGGTKGFPDRIFVKDIDIIGGFGD